MARRYPRRHNSPRTPVIVYCVEHHFAGLTRLLNDDDRASALCAAGFDDGQIPEINQVVAYFAYANRTVLGLGVTTAGDILGLSPNNSDNPADWSHRLSSRRAESEFP